MSNEHQPGSPGVDLDALERRLELDLGSWGNLNTYRRVFAELRTLRARVAEFEMPDAEADRILTMSDEELDAEIRAVGIDPVELDKRASHVAKWAAECSKLRARVGELEKCLNGLHLFAGRGDGHETADKVTDCIAGVIIQLRADLEKAEARAESAEARVKELEAWVRDLESDARADAEMLHKRDDRITSLESQLAAAREEQGLERLVRATLKERNDSLAFYFSTPWWCARWLSRDESERGRALERVQAETLPALLRAILEEEAKGG